MPLAHVNVWEGFGNEKTKTVIQNITKVFVDFINHLWQEKNDKMMTWKTSNILKIPVNDTGWFTVI